ncbi:YaaC family protein [Paraliobacillus salinarum]|uniref:YaaC family protein n=1 Tax=Paraliobacillus salinarum TaxID=1158996 RepID=UPI0015F614BE|nr:YaaC family protein [Paraliobacillus salinarum]
MKQSMSTLYHYLESQENAHQFLNHCYEQKGLTNPTHWSYQNGERFYYMIKHGLIYYQTADQSPITIRPLLYYYGMMHLIKACLLTIIPTYPESTALLAHGLSTRKQKKQNYQLLADEVKIQQKGLFRYFSTHLFKVKTFTKEKFYIEQLLKAIPELNNLFFLQQKNHPFVKVGRVNESTLTFPNIVLDNYHVTQDRFINKLQGFINITEVKQTKTQFQCKLDQPVPVITNQPLYIHSDNHHVYFPLNTDVPMQHHEIMHHYMLLYHLSMIVRYESEWWGDFVQTQHSSDYSIITHFLSITSKKVPYFFEHFLKQYM